MRSLLELAGLALLLALPALADARCGDSPGDDAAVAAARAQVADDCNCAAAATHTTYIRCASDVARQRADANLLPVRCISAVKRCAVRSVCGRPGAVTCCLTRSGATRCSIKRDPALCQAPAGSSACIGLFESCCDACVDGGCATSSTTTSTTTTTTLFSLVPCEGGSGVPVCDGACSGDDVCRYYSAESSGCACFPPGATPCEPGQFPQCGGVCPGSDRCGAVQVRDPARGLNFDSCGCIDPTKTCPTTGQCGPLGYCGPGFACYYDASVPAFCGPANPCCGCIAVF